MSKIIGVTVGTPMNPDKFGGTVSDEQIAQAVESYLTEHPVQGGAGLTSAQIAALDGMFQIAAYTVDDATAAYTAFKEAFGLTGDTPDIPDIPDIPDVPDVPDHTHNYTSSVTTAATCTTEGVKTYTCTCGHSYTEKIAKTAHAYVDGICTKCGAVESTGGDSNVLDAWTAYEWDMGYRIYGTTAENVQEGDDFATTKEYISTENVEKIVISAEGTGGLGQFGVFFFDAAKTIVSSAVDYISPTNASYPTPRVIEIPSGAAYYRLTTMDKSTLDGTNTKLTIKYNVYPK